MTKFLGLILILIFPIKILAQVGHITGTVINQETKIKVPGVNISAYDQSDILYNTITDSAGNFTMPLNLFNRINYIKIRALNFNDLFVKKVEGKLIGETYVFDTIKITPRIIELKEVKVVSNKRYSDTVKIDLFNQRFEHKISIDDFFSTNGFSKDFNGVIYYKGKPVSDLLVDGREFFGKNNKQIYKLLPALVLNDIQIVETNIDSVTNTTMLSPNIKVNLNFKEKYKKGKFGNVSEGLGTEGRYLIGSGLFGYKNNEQFSLLLNSNSIDIKDIPLAEPAISFSTNGNAVKANNAAFTYSNKIGKKVELNMSGNGRIDNKVVTSEAERQDTYINQYSKSTNSSKSKVQGITSSKLNMIYKIDSVNLITLTQSANYIKTATNDSVNYIIHNDSSELISNLNKKQSLLNVSSVTDLNYKRLFASKKGRSLAINLNQTYNRAQNVEYDDIYSSSNGFDYRYFIDGKRKTVTNLHAVNINYIEPISEEAYLDIYSMYKSDHVDYNPEIFSDSLTNFFNIPVKLRNQCFQSGFKYRLTSAKNSLDGSVASLFYQRSSVINGEENTASFFNVDISLRASRIFNSKKSLIVSYNTSANYPDLNQLINIDNSFDLISQVGSNLNLKPEVKNSLRVTYNLKASGIGVFSFDGDIDYYTNKFGLNSNIEAGKPQTMFVDNIGKALSAKVGVSLHTTVSDNFSFDYLNSFTYLEQPTNINNKINLNNGFVINQVFSTGQSAINKIFSISPSINTTYSTYYFGASKSNIFSVIYSDNLSLSLSKFKIDLYPLFNYSHNINSLTSFSLNGGIKKTLFNSGTIWLQAYDILKSFKYNNNFFGPNFTQSIKYSTVNRYFIIGLTFKFDNMK